MFFKQRCNDDSSIFYFLGCGGHGLAVAVDVLAGGAYALHESNAGKTNFAFTPLHDDAVLPVGNTQVRVLHTPGHTDDSISLVVTDLRRGNAPWFVLTGDTLFVGAVGRPDLGGREHEMASKLWRSLHTKLLQEAFVALVVQEIPAQRPMDMDRIVATNLGQYALA